MKVKTSELIGPALDWAVAKGEGWTDQQFINGLKDGEYGLGFFKPSTNWAQGGPIIEREGIQITPNLDGSWRAIRVILPTIQPILYGTTPLIAVMRCYVASKLGDEVEIPEELL